MHNNERLKFYLATVILVGLVGFLLYTLSPFFNAFFGAFLVFFLFKTFNNYLVNKKSWKPYLSAAFIMFISTLVVLVPLFVGSSLLFGEVTSFVSDSGSISNFVSSVSSVASTLPLDIASNVNDFLNNSSSFIADMVFSIAGNFVSILLNLVIFYFVLYFLLVKGHSLQSLLEPYLPFSKKNSNKLVKKFKDITYATVVASGLIALFQGIFIAIGFLIFDVSNPVFWGFIAIVISFLPALGVPLIWVPAALIKIFSQDNLFAGVGLIIWGSLSYIADTFVRPVIQKQVGEVHPLITIVGVFAGLPVFGLLGLFIGPLLIAYTFLIIKIYAEEYGGFNN